MPSGSRLHKLCLPICRVIKLSLDFQAKPNSSNCYLKRRIVPNQRNCTGNISGVVILYSRQILYPDIRYGLLQENQNLDRYNGLVTPCRIWIIMSFVKSKNLPPIFNHIPLNSIVKIYDLSLNSFKNIMKCQQI